MTLAFMLASVNLAQNNRRAQEISDMKFGMFICWSYSTFYGEEWTPTLDKDASFFKATGCDTDQWCKLAKDAGMSYISFLSKHHDGFCLWNTETTAEKVTNSPLGIDVLAQLRKSCDKYGIKLASIIPRVTVEWVHSFQPECFVGFNHGEPAGRLSWCC